MRRLVLAVLLVLSCGPDYADAAPGDFYPGGSTLPGPKADWGACRNGDPNRCFRASDYNAFRDALGDLRIGLSSSPTFSGTVTISGDLELASGSSQYVRKSSGDLVFQTTGAYPISFWTDSTSRWQITAAGDFAPLGAGPRITGLQAPLSASEPATKGYVETRPAGVSFVGSGGFSVSAYSRKGLDGRVTLMGTVAYTGTTPAATNFATLGGDLWPRNGAGGATNATFGVLCTDDSSNTYYIKPFFLLGDGRCRLPSGLGGPGTTTTCYLDGVTYYADP